MNLKLCSWRWFIFVVLCLFSVCVVSVWLKSYFIEAWYVRQLSASDSEIKRVAALKLSDIKSRRAVPLLIDMIGEEAIEPPTVVGDIRKQRTYVRESLAKLGPLSAHGLFDALLSANEEAKRDYIAETLGDMGETGTQLLWKALEHPNASVRRAAIYALWSVEKRASNWEGMLSAASSLVVSDENAEVRNAAMRASNWERLLSAASNLVVSDENAEVRNAAATILDGMGPSAARALPNLSKAVRDPNSEVQITASLAIFHILRSAEACIQAIESQDEYLMESTIRMLEFDPRDQESIPILRKHSSVQYPSGSEAQEWKKFAVYALKKFHGAKP